MKAGLNELFHSMFAVFSRGRVRETAVGSLMFDLKSYMRVILMLILPIIASRDLSKISYLRESMPLFNYTSCIYHPPSCRFEGNQPMALCVIGCRPLFLAYTDRIIHTRAISEYSLD